MRVARANGRRRVQCRPAPRSTWLAMADSRARSSGDTLADVSASTATATLVWYTTIRGPLSASTMQTNAAVLSPSARRRADCRHSHAAQPSGRRSASNTYARSKLIAPPGPMRSWNQMGSRVLDAETRTQRRFRGFAATHRPGRKAYRHLVGRRKNSTREGLAGAAPYGALGLVPASAMGSAASAFSDFDSLGISPRLPPRLRVSAPNRHLP